MESLEKIRGIYQDYLEQVADLYHHKKLFQGLFSFSGGPQNDPCHQSFFDRMEQALGNSDTASPEELLDLIRFMYRQPLEHTDSKSAWWMLMAVQKMTIPMLPRIPSAEVGPLYDWFCANYPRRMRLPPQEEILKVLRNRSQL